MGTQFHITYSPPNSALEHWPQGCWSLYEITGDQIADRTVRKEIVVPADGAPYYKGDVIARHSWCGFVGCYHSLADTSAAILKRANETEARRLREITKAPAA